MNLENVKAFFVKDSPRWLEWLVIIVLIACAAGGVKQLVDPPTIVEHDSDVKVVKREVIRWRTSKAVDTYRKETPVLLTQPDGGAPIVGAIIESGTRTRENSEGSSNSILDSSTVTHTKTTPVLPQWRIGGQVGASWQKPWVPIAGPLVFGIQGERRIIGPVWGGAWFSTYGAAGVSVSGEF